MRMSSKKPSAIGQTVRWVRFLWGRCSRARAYAQRESRCGRARDQSNRGELAPGRNQQPVCIDRVTQILRQDRGDFGECVVRSIGKPPVGPPRDKARPQHQCLQFLLGEHQWREHEAWPQHKPDTRLPVNRCALGDQALDVAIDRAQRHAELFGQHGAADRTTMPAQDLNEFEQPLRARHVWLPRWKPNVAREEDKHGMARTNKSSGRTAAPSSRSGLLTSAGADQYAQNL